MTAERCAVLAEMVGEMQGNLTAIEAAVTLSSPAVELDLRMASDCLDHAACLLRVLQHDHHRHLFDEAS